MKKLITLLSLLCVLFFIGCEKQDTPLSDNSSSENTTLDSTETVSTEKILRNNFAKGADVSWLTEMEASGIPFYNSSGAKEDLFAILKSKGMNSIRLRLWVNPIDGWNNIEDVLVKAQRAKAAGMKIMLQFHYSDEFADPGRQVKPAAWTNHSIEQLYTDVWDHTVTALTILKNNGIEPKWIQVGNETNDGMLWDEGKASLSEENMRNFAWLITTGYNAVKSILPNAKVIVHISNGYDNVLFRWILDGITRNGAKYDIIGMSLYAEASNWQKLNAQCLDNMNDMVNRYGKKIMICEVGMASDQPKACKAFLKDLIKKTNSVKKGKVNYGLGVFYWEPQVYNDWKGYKKGAWAENGRPTIALNAFLLK